MDSFNMVSKYCQFCEGNILLLMGEVFLVLLEILLGWEFCESWLEKVFVYKNYYEVMVFVNVVVWVLYWENYYLELIVGYKDCWVSYWMYVINGLLENDFICVVKVE